MSINAIPPLPLFAPTGGSSVTNSVAANSGLGKGTGLAQAGGDFAKFLDNALQQVDALQKNADAASTALATGQAPDIHTVMIALDKANLALSLTVQVRNKALDAYQEIMRMQI